MNNSLRSKGTASIQPEFAHRRKNNKKVTPIIAPIPEIAQNDIVNMAAPIAILDFSFAPNPIKACLMNLRMELSAEHRDILNLMITAIKDNNSLAWLDAVDQIPANRKEACKPYATAMNNLLCAEPKPPPSTSANLQQGEPGNRANKSMAEVFNAHRSYRGMFDNELHENIFPLILVNDLNQTAIAGRTLLVRGGFNNATKLPAEQVLSLMALNWIFDQTSYSTANAGKLMKIMIKDYEGTPSVDDARNFMFNIIGLLINPLLEDVLRKGYEKAHSRMTLQHNLMRIDQKSLLKLFLEDAIGSLEGHNIPIGPDPNNEGAEPSGDYLINEIQGRCDNFTEGIRYVLHIAHLEVVVKKERESTTTNNKNSNSRHAAPSPATGAPHSKFGGKNGDGTIPPGWGGTDTSLAPTSLPPGKKPDKPPAYSGEPCHNWVNNLCHATCPNKRRHDWNGSTQAQKDILTQYCNDVRPWVRHYIWQNWHDKNEPPDTFPTRLLR